MPLSVEQATAIIQMIGVVVGALWAAWSFHKLQRIRAAELDNESKLTMIQKTRLEQEEIRTQLLRRQPQLAIQLQITEAPSFNDIYKSFLCISVKLKNEGEQNLRLDFSPSALTVGRVTFDKDKKQTTELHYYGPPYFDGHNDEPVLFSYRILRVGQARETALAIIPVPEPGAYIVQYRTDYHKILFEV